MSEPITASWLSRIGALFVDWTASYLVTFFILRDVQHPAFAALSLGIFWLETAVGIALTGSSFGQTVARRRPRSVQDAPGCHHGPERLHRPGHRRDGG